MFYKIIFAYLFGVIFAIKDTTYISIGLMSFIILYILYSLFVKDTFIKDILRIIKDIRSLFYLSVSFIILFFVFYMSFRITISEQKKVSYKDIDGKTFQIIGTVVSLNRNTSGEVDTIRVDSMRNLSDQSVVEDVPRYIDLSVTQWNNLKLYDGVSFIGTTNFKNYKIYEENQPLFFQYEFSKLFYNSSWTVSYPRELNIIVRQKSYFEELRTMLNSFGETISNNLNTYMSAPYSSVAEGITLGNQENLTKELKDIFKASGLIHILVLSGANVSLIIILFTRLLSFTKLNKKLKAFFSLLFSWVFIFFTGLSAPSVRAGTMSSTNILSEVVGKNISTLQSLIFALFILTLLNPLTLVFSPSLHLSFLACFGLFIATPKIEILMKSKFLFLEKNALLNLFISACFGIFIFTSPYILALAGTTSLFGTLLSFLVEPVVLLVTIFTFLIIIFSFLNFHITTILSFINTVFVKIILAFANFGADYLPQISIKMTHTFLIFYYAILFFVFVIILTDDESK